LGSPLGSLKNKHVDAKLDIHEVEAILRSETPNISQKEVVGIFKGVDKTGSGLVSFGDLVDYIFADTPAKPVVLASPALEGLAKEMRKILGIEDKPLVDWETFKSGDPNIRYSWEAISGQRVIFLFDAVDQSRLLEQLSLLQVLQGFPVPEGKDVSTKWKTYAGSGRYYWGRASEIIVVIPWYRPCQMERTSRWDRTEEGKWTNKIPEGAWLDVPCAQTFVRLLATPGLPFPGPPPIGALDGKSLEPRWRPPVKGVFIELHEEEPVQIAAADLGVEVRNERFAPYFLGKFKASQSFIESGTEKTYVLFPDHGAYDRNRDFCINLLTLAPEHVLWMNKSRTGGTIEQEKKINFMSASGEQGEKSTFTGEDHVVILDDFTNSGSTLFGAAALVKSLAGDAADALQTTIFVSHTVASYDDAALEGMASKLEKMGPTCKYCTTDTLPKSAAFFSGNPQVQIFPISEFLAELVR